MDARYFSNQICTMGSFWPQLFLHRDFGAEGKWNTNGANRYTLSSISDVFWTNLLTCVCTFFSNKFAPWGHFDPNCFFLPWLKYEKKLWMSMLHTIIIFWYKLPERKILHKWIYQICRTGSFWLLLCVNSLTIKLTANTHYFFINWLQI